MIACTGKGGQEVMFGECHSLRMNQKLENLWTIGYVG
jgi:hypothetical protein